MSIKSLEYIERNEKIKIGMIKKKKEKGIAKITRNIINPIKGKDKNYKKNLRIN